MNTSPMIVSSVARSSRRQAFERGLWLAVAPAMACFYVWLHLSGRVYFGLGWAVQPGLFVFLGIVALTALELRAGRGWRILWAVACLLAALFLEWYFPFGELYPFVGIGLTLVGLAIQFDGARGVRILDAGFLLIAAYEQSVFIYNMFCGTSRMGFFMTGWTA